MANKPTFDEPVADVLIEGPIHKTMLFFCIPERWPGWVVMATAVFLSIIIGIIWSLLSWVAQAGWLIVVMQSVFVGVDTAVLRTLPQRKISFGPWKAQLMALSVPRFVATLGVALLTLWLDWQTALIIAIVIQTMATAAYAWGLFVEIHRLSLTHLTITTDRLAADAPPIRLLHITDLHIERLTGREEKVLRLVQESAPDLIVMTGDYVNLSYNQDPITHAQVRELLAQLSAPYGVYATLGSPPVDLRQEVVPLFEGLCIDLLRHDYRVVDVGQGRQLVLLGLDVTHHLPTDRQRLDWLMADTPNHAPSVFLYHSPEIMPEAVQHDIDLYLCGHTHGGQIRLPFIGPLLTSSQLGRRYVMGLYKEKRTHLYVSRGIGLEGLSAPRARFMAPPEMTLITLQGNG